ncbi:aromatic prenyltransferase [Lentzea sp. NPDC051213]|uniref:aromatic prenyltransferase n=1 Tax=Lentzea sp. NPDC051213 TaxID=3364126 RepID=UPI003797A917
MLPDTKTDLVQLHTDLRKYAEIAEVDFNDRAVSEMIDTFNEQYATGTITVRTTTQNAAKRTVNFRYMTPELPHNPVATARQKGLLKSSGHPVESMVDEVIDRLPLWWGVDASVARGMEKAWAFFEEPPTFDELLELKYLPESVRNHRERFAKVRLERFCIMAFDFHNGSMNLYSEMLTPGSFTRAEVAMMIQEMDAALPSDEEIGRDTEAVNAYYTFDWDVPQARRLCFAMTASEENFPKHWHPLAERFAVEAPFQAEQRGLIFNPTYGPTGGYLKVEADYTGDAGPRVFSYWNR